MILFRRDAVGGGNHGCERNYRKKVCCALSDERTSTAYNADPEREQPGATTDEGRICLKADVSEARRMERHPKSSRPGDQPVHGLRVRKQLVEEGFEAVLSRKPRATPAVPRFDGEKEAKLIALACSEPPRAARWNCGCWRTRSWS